MHITVYVPCHYTDLDSAQSVHPKNPFIKDECDVEEEEEEEGRSENKSKKSASDEERYASDAMTRTHKLNYDLLCIIGLVLLMLQWE